MRWVAAVGRLVGAIVAAGAWGGARLDGWSGALLALLLWVGVTGALHLDGLGDIADARGAAHKDHDRMIAALSDPHVGSFAVVAIALQLIAKRSDEKTSELPSLMGSQHDVLFLETQTH